MMLFTVAEHHQNAEFLHLFGPITQKRDFGQKNVIHVKMFKNGQKTYRNHKKYNFFFYIMLHIFLPFCQKVTTGQIMYPIFF